MDDITNMGLRVYGGEIGPDATEADGIGRWWQCGALWLRACITILRNGIKS